MFTLDEIKIPHEPLHDYLEISLEGVVPSITLEMIYEDFILGDGKVEINPDNNSFAFTGVYPYRNVQDLMKKGYSLGPLFLLESTLALYQEGSVKLGFTVCKSEDFVSGSIENLYTKVGIHDGMELVTFVNQLREYAFAAGLYSEEHLEKISSTINQK